MTGTFFTRSRSRLAGTELRPLVRFGGLALLFVPFALPWQYLTEQSLVELSPGEGMVVWAPSGTIYPVETDASGLLYVGAVMAIALMALRGFTWLIYLAGGTLIMWAWNGRHVGGPALSGWEGPGQMLLESGAVALGLSVYGVAVFVGQVIVSRASAGVA